MVHTSSANEVIDPRNVKGDVIRRSSEAVDRNSDIYLAAVTVKQSSPDTLSVLVRCVAPLVSHRRGVRIIGAQNTNLIGRPPESSPGWIGGLGLPASPVNCAEPTTWSVALI